jgi:hypothetical protein
MNANLSPGLDLSGAEALLRQRLGLRVQGPHLFLRDGRVVLQGRAVNYHAKQLAQHIVFEALGRPALRNEIEVCPPPPVPADDNVTR